MRFSNQKVAVLGTGSIGRRHLRVLKNWGEVAAVAVPKHSDRLGEWQAAGVETAHDLKEAYAQGAEFCIIASDTAAHVSDAMSALKLGMNVLVEKPLAVDAPSALAVVFGARQNVKNIFVGCILRFSESLGIFREWLPKIGPVYSVQIACQSYLPDWRPGRDWRQTYSARPQEGGVLRDLIHEIDTATSIFGWPRAVAARLRNREILKIEAEEEADIGWETPEGISVSVRLDYLSRIPRRQMSAFGAEGVLTWDGIQNRVTLEKPDASPEIFLSQQSHDEMFLRQTQSFLKGKKTDDCGTLCSLEEAIRALSLCDAARVASRNRREGAIHYLI